MVPSLVVLLALVAHARVGAAVAGAGLPRIEIRGANPLKVGVFDLGHDYQDAGADCSAAHGGRVGALNAHLAVAGDHVDLTKAGTYTVVFFCDNSAGIANATRTVVVNEKFNPGCEKLRVTGAPSSDLGQMGTYNLVPGKLSDGKPIYAQADGCQCNHIYFLANERRNTHEWFVDKKDVWRRTQAEDNRLYVNDKLHRGLRTYAWAPRPEDIRKTWQLWDPASRTYGDVPDVHVRCHEQSKHKGSSAAAKYHITASVQLVGIGLKDFSEKREYEFCTAAAEALDVAVEDVTIVEIVDDYHFGRRRLVPAASAARAGMLGVSGLTGVRIEFEVSTLFRVVEKGVVRKLRAERFQETLWDAMAAAGLSAPKMRLMVDSKSVRVARPVGSGTVVKMALGVASLALAVGLLSASGRRGEGGGGCFGKRRAAKTFSEAGCSTDDIDFSSINDMGELDVCIEETIPLSSEAAMGAPPYQQGSDDDDGSDDDAL